MIAGTSECQHVPECAATGSKLCRACACRSRVKGTHWVPGLGAQSTLRQIWTLPLRSEPGVRPGSSVSLLPGVLMALRNLHVDSLSLVKAQCARMSSRAQTANIFLQDAA